MTNLGVRLLELQQEYSEARGRDQWGRLGEGEAARTAEDIGSEYADTLRQLLAADVPAEEGQ